MNLKNYFFIFLMLHSITIYTKIDWLKFKAPLFLYESPFGEKAAPFYWTPQNHIHKTTQLTQPPHLYSKQDKELINKFATITESLDTQEGFVTALLHPQAQREGWTVGPKWKKRNSHDTTLFYNYKTGEEIQFEKTPRNTFIITSKNQPNNLEISQKKLNSYYLLPSKLNS